jgi:hypothetical protein
LREELFIATEGMYTGQFVYCGKKGIAKQIQACARVSSHTL